MCVFSAHAEVVPKASAVKFVASRILRARGGSSFLHTQACATFPVFSAHAEVVPILHGPANHPRGILRARGGSSSPLVAMVPMVVYSPRTRR